MHPQFESLAQALAQAWKDGRTLALPPLEASPQTRDEAFEVQDRMAEIIGDRCVGWKVGAAVKAVQVMEGHDGPIVGRLLASRLFTTPGQLRGALFDGCTVESEFAFRFTENLPARSRPYTREEIDPLLVFHPGLELAGPRWSAAPGQRKGRTFDAIADNGVAAAYINDVQVVGPVACIVCVAAHEQVAQGVRQTGKTRVKAADFDRVILAGGPDKS